MVLDVVPSQALEILQRDLGLSTDELARALQVNPRTIERWRTGDSYPQREARQRLKALGDVHRHLGQTFRDYAGARQWLDDPSRYLGWLTPREVLRAGRFDRVEAALTVLDSGIFI